MQHGVKVWRHTVAFKQASCDFHQQLTLQKHSSVHEDNVQQSSNDGMLVGLDSNEIVRSMQCDCRIVDELCLQVIYSLSHGNRELAIPRDPK